MNISEELKQHLLNEGASDVGFAYIDNSDTGFNYAVSICVRLSDSIINEIGEEPTHTYFNHYRSVNAFIDRLLLCTGLFLQKKGYEYITVAASQSINKDGWDYKGRYSHKEAARKAGLGTIGKSSLFIHKDFGPNVRLGTVFTNCELEVAEPLEECICGECDICVRSCPANAITGRSWDKTTEREDMFRPELCSQYMKTHFKDIGRGAVCGICIKSCSKRKKP